MRRWLLPLAFWKERKGETSGRVESTPSDRKWSTRITFFPKTSHNFRQKKRAKSDTPEGRQGSFNPNVLGRPAGGNPLFWIRPSFLVDSSLAISSKFRRRQASWGFSFSFPLSFPFPLPSPSPSPSPFLPVPRQHHKPNVPLLDSCGSSIDRAATQKKPTFKASSLSTLASSPLLASSSRRKRHRRKVGRRWGGQRRRQSNSPTLWS